MGYVINLKAETGLVDRTLNTTRFYKDIKDYKPFTKEEEVKWFTKLKEARERMEKAKSTNDNGGYAKAKKEYEKIREYIVLCNQRLVIAAAKNFSTTDTLTDYINEINFDLIEAVDKYDVTKGVMVKKSNSYKTFHVVSKARNKFMQEYEREPTTDELLEILNEEYNKKIRDKNDLLDVNYSSIDVDVSSDDDNYSRGEAANYNRRSASYNEYEKTSTNEFNAALISSLLDILPPRERQIIEMRFGLYDNNGLNREYELNEIAEILNLTSERVRQLELESIKMLRNEYINRMGEL